MNKFLVWMIFAPKNPLKNLEKNLGKLFSYALPLISFILACCTSVGVFNAPTWPARTIFFFLTLLFIIVGIVFIVKRKKI